MRIKFNLKTLFLIFLLTMLIVGVAGKVRAQGAEGFVTAQELKVDNAETWTKDNGEKLLDKLNKEEDLIKFQEQVKANPDKFIEAAKGIKDKSKREEFIKKLTPENKAKVFSQDKDSKSPLRDDIIKTIKDEIKGKNPKANFPEIKGLAGNEKLTLELNKNGEYILKNDEGGFVNLNNIDKSVSEIGIVGKEGLLQDGTKNENMVSYFYEKTKFHQTDESATSVYFNEGSLVGDNYVDKNGNPSSIHVGYSVGGSVIIGTTNAASGLTVVNLKDGGAIGAITQDGKNAQIARVLGTEQGGVLVGKNGKISEFLNGDKAKGIEIWDMNGAYAQITNDYFGVQNNFVQAQKLYQQLADQKQTTPQIDFYGKFFDSSVTFGDIGQKIDGKDVNVGKGTVNIGKNPAEVFMLKSVQNAQIGNGNPNVGIILDKTDNNIQILSRDSGRVLVFDGEKLARFNGGDFFKIDSDFKNINPTLWKEVQPIIEQRLKQLEATRQAAAASQAMTDCQRAGTCPVSSEDEEE